MAKSWSSLNIREQTEALYALVTGAASPAQLARRTGVSQALLLSKRRDLDSTSRNSYGFDVIAEELVARISAEVRSFMSDLARTGANRGNRPTIRTLTFEYERAQQILPTKFWTEPSPGVRDALPLLTELYDLPSDRSVPETQRLAKQDLLLTAFLVRHHIPAEMLSWKSQLLGLMLLEMVRVLEQVARKLKRYCTEKTRMVVRFPGQPVVIAGHHEALEAYVVYRFQGVFHGHRSLEDFAALCFNSPTRQQEFCYLQG